MPMTENWTIEKAAELYGIHHWGGGFFTISDQGHVVIQAAGANGKAAIGIMDIVAGMRDRGIGMPAIIRFGDILAARIRQIHESFRHAIEQTGYQGVYRGVYPIKVNQQQQVVEEVTASGAAYHHGLEAGSKGELIAALAYMRDPEAFIICNGYKDAEFIDLSLYAQKMGLRPVLVLEMPGELSLILERGQRMNVKPWLGVRAKLSVQAEGHWSHSGGDQSKFGLNASQIIDVIDSLREQELLGQLRMLHYHLGSQVPNIISIRMAVSEATRIYINLVREGARMGVLNVGGGLAVDYDGSHSNAPSSSNYNLDEYAYDVVETILDLLKETDIPHPVIVSESGRATVAHHSVLVFNVLDVSRLESHGLPESLAADAHTLLYSLMEVKDVLAVENLQECYNDAIYYRDEIRSRFEHGTMSLRERALGEGIFWHVIREIIQKMKPLEYIPDELTELEGTVADVYHGNFSVFQSLPDAWAIDHIFPIMPIHRLDTRPSRLGTLADITCDCDGSIHRFIDQHHIRRTLPVHDRGGGDYYLGVFLTGAYQETLGDLHNLLGDTNVVNVKIGEDGRAEFAREIEGDTVADVLAYMEYNPVDMIDHVRGKAERAVRAGRISPLERREIMAAYQDGLRGYTYFEG